METLEDHLRQLSPDRRRLVELWLRQKQATHFAPPESDQIPHRDPNIHPPLSFAQQRLWFMHQLEPDSPAYNLRTVVRLQGLLDRSILQRSLIAIIQRHEVLRTTFASQDGQPVQVIAPTLAFPLPLIDLRHLSPDEQPAQIQQHALQETEQPFDLAHGPLLRACLLCLAANEHVLVLTMHHSISDGWSQGIQLRELAALYAACARGRPSPLPELPIQYADFAAWQRQWLQGERLEQQLAYWQAHLGAQAHVLDLSTDHPRPMQASARGAWEYFTFPIGLRDQLNSLSRREGVTLFMTLLAAFNVLLSRYSGQDDIVVGTPVAGRTRPELEGLIGCFVNMLPLRTELAGNPSFVELLRRVRKVLLGAYAHQELPFEQLVEVMQLPRDLSRNPIFQVLFVLQNMPMPALESGELTFLPQEVTSTTATLDLSLYVREVADGLLIRVEYNTDLFEPATIGRMLAQFQTLLAGIVADPSRPLAGLPLLGPEERQCLLVDWNATSVPYPQTIALNQMFETQAARAPDAITVICGDKRMTYAELNRRANQLARHVRECGVGAEVRVGVCLERSLELVIALLAILKAGGVYVPIDPDYPPDRVSFMLEDTQPAALITGTEIRDWRLEIKGSEQSLISNLQSPSLIYLDRDWPQIARQSGDNLDSVATIEQATYMVYTSGSTGRPKGVVLPQRQLLNRFAWMWREFPFGAGEVGAQKTTVNFVDSIWELLGGLLQGVPTAIIPDAVVRDPQQFVEALAREHVTRMLVVPALLRMLLDLYPDLHARLPRLRFWVTSGEALTLDLAQRFYHQMPGCRLVNLYGTSEVFDASVAEVPAELGANARIPIGRPLDNTQIYLLDRHLLPVPLGVVGELCVAGAGLARGYLNRPDLTAEKFIPNPFADLRFTIYDLRLTATDDPIQNPKPVVSNVELSKIQNGERLYRTGDLARYRPDGQIEYQGRGDHQIKVRGVRIEPGEIELALAEHPAVRQAVVVARPDQSGDARLVAYLVPTTDSNDKVTRRQADTVIESSETFTPSPLRLVTVSGSSVVGELRGFLQDRLPAAMIPGAFVLLEALPLTPNGKVNRRALPAPEAARVEAAAYVAPSTPTEVALAQVWSQVLKIPRIGIHDNFFELGGDSLMVMQLVARVRQAGLELAPREIFARQTIAELAPVVGIPALVQAEQAIITGPLPLTEGPAWLLSRGLAEVQRPFWHVVRLFDVPPLDSAALAQVTAALLRHHDALRARFVEEATGWRTWIAPPDDRVPFERIDLTTVPDGELQAAVEQHGNAVQTRINLAEGPLMLVIYMDCGPARAGRLLVVVHHLVADLHAMWILLDDLLRSYQQLQQSQSLQLTPKTAPLTVWGERLHTYAQSPQQRAAFEAWCQLPWNAIPPLPCDYLVPREAATCNSQRTVRMALDADTTQRLIRRLPAQYQAQPVEGMMAALLYGLMQWSPERWFGLLMVEGGRDNLPTAEDLDMSRTVGWLANCRYVILERAGSRPDEVLAAMLGQLRRTPGLRHDLHRYLSNNAAAERLDGLPRYEILFNYAGQMLNSETSLMVRPSVEDCDSQGSPEDPVAYQLECWPALIDGQLSVRLLYSTRLHRRETIEWLGREFLAALQALAAPE